MRPVRRDDSNSLETTQSGHPQKVQLIEVLISNFAHELLSGARGRLGQMSKSEKSQYIRATVILQMASILAFWVMAFIVWWASLWHADFYTRLGADLTSLTKAIIWSAQVGLPFMLAAFFSVVVAFQMRKPGHESVVLPAWLLVASILFSAFAIRGMTLSMTMACGEVVPGWPSTIESEDSNSCRSLK